MVPVYWFYVQYRPAGRQDHEAERRIRPVRVLFVLRVRPHPAVAIRTRWPRSPAAVTMLEVQREVVHGASSADDDTTGIQITLGIFVFATFRRKRVIGQFPANLRHSSSQIFRLEAAVRLDRPRGSRSLSIPLGTRNASQTLSTERQGRAAACIR